MKTKSNRTATLAATVAAALMGLSAAPAAVGADAPKTTASPCAGNPCAGSKRKCAKSDSDNPCAGAKCKKNTDNPCAGKSK